MVWLRDSEKSLRIRNSNTFSRFDRIPTCDRQTDGRTNGQTDILRRYSPRCVLYSIVRYNCLSSAMLCMDRI